MMFHLFRNKHFYFIVASDSILIVLSLYLAYAVRFDFQILEIEHYGMMDIWPYVLLIKIMTFFIFRLYQGMWRYTGLIDMLRIIRANVVSSSIIIAGIVLFNRFEGYPRSVFLIDWGLTFIFIGGFRLGIRLHFARTSGLKVLTGFSGKQFGKRVLIIGAGDTGAKVLREMLEHPSPKLVPVGFLDDDSEKYGKTIHGVQILGGLEQLSSLQELYDEILIAVPSLSGERMRRIVSACQQTGKHFRLVPAMQQLISGNLSMKLERRITIQDVLGRDEISLDKENIAEYLRQKRVLVTGAGGSIGSELVRQIRQFQPEALALLDMGEFNLFQISMECAGQHNNFIIHNFLADIRDANTIEQIFQRFQPQVVFHAAAYKHVPLQEQFPWEAVHNNIRGTRNLIEAAQRHNVKKFVLVSSDKAVRPSSVMGATKRVAEKLIACANNKPHSQFMAVRFGNVIGSSGSVIPLFQEQIARGGPVTVTHPEVIRYFMSIPEAAQLILQAGSMGKGGEIFLLEMGKALRIADLARDLIQLYGYEVDKDIKIQYTGLRPGEKLYEELYSETEELLDTAHKSITILQSSCDDPRRLQQQLEQLFNLSDSYDHERIKKMLQEIVPEYTAESHAKKF